MAKSKGKSKKSKPATPGHYTAAGTRKFQANGPQEWGKIFMAAAKAAAGEREGEGIRLAMMYAVEHEKGFLTWAKSQAPSEGK